MTKSIGRRDFGRWAKGQKIHGSRNGATSQRRLFGRRHFLTTPFFDPTPASRPRGTSFCHALHSAEQIHARLVATSNQAMSAIAFQVDRHEWVDSQIVLVATGVSRACTGFLRFCFTRTPVTSEQKMQRPTRASLAGLSRHFSGETLERRASEGNATSPAGTPNFSKNFYLQFDFGLIVMA